MTLGNNPQDFKQGFFFLFSKTSRLVLGPTQPPTEAVPGFFPGSPRIRSLIFKVPK
jgi:hypothetical protein